MYFGKNQSYILADIKPSFRQLYLEEWVLYMCYIKQLVYICSTNSSEDNIP